MTLTKLVHSLKEFSKYINKFKNSLRRVKASTRKDTTSIESITSFKKEMRYGCTLVRKGCKEKVKAEAYLLWSIQNPQEGWK